MNWKRSLAVALALFCTLSLVGGALALSSTQYRLDWFTPLTTGGGGSADSDQYGINLTVGQTAMGTFSSANYKLCLGYWCGTWLGYPVYLPLVLRNAGNP
jgi:hypothetical protein